MEKLIIEKLVNLEAMILSLKQIVVDSPEKTETEKSNYQETMLAEIKNTHNWSNVRYAYFASFFVQAGTLLTIFFIASPY